MSGIPGRHADQFNLRLPDGMRERIAESAKANSRSMNAEIVARLESTFQAPAPSGRTDPAAIDDLRAAARMFYEAAEMARTQGGRISLELKVEGVDDEATHDAISDKAFNAVTGGASKPD
jgi:hypothetical protein